MPDVPVAAGTLRSLVSGCRLGRDGGCLARLQAGRLGGDAVEDTQRLAGRARGGRRRRGVGAQDGIARCAQAPRRPRRDVRKDGARQIDHAGADTLAVERGDEPVGRPVVARRDDDRIDQSGAARGALCRGRRGGACRRRPDDRAGQRRQQDQCRHARQGGKRNYTGRSESAARHGRERHAIVETRGRCAGCRRRRHD